MASIVYSFVGLTTFGWFGLGLGRGLGALGTLLGRTDNEPRQFSLINLRINFVIYDP